MKQVVPEKIHVLDLFCGNAQRLKQLAKKHPKKTFIGVDSEEEERFPKKVPKNLILVNDNALGFLIKRNRNTRTNVRQVNIDYGIHFLNEKKQAALFRHLSKAIIPGGKMWLTTYEIEKHLDSLIREAAKHGFKLTRVEPLTQRRGATISSYGQNALLLEQLGDCEFRSVRLAFKKNPTFISNYCLGTTLI